MPDSSVAGFLVPSSTPPADDLSLDALFQTMVVGLTGLAGSLVRPRWQPTVPKQPEATVNWCAVGVTNVNGDDNPATVHNPFDASGTGSDTLYRHELIEVFFSFYGPKGQQYAEMARDGLWLPQNNGMLAQYLMTFTTEADPVRSVPDLVNEQWRRRYDFTARFRRQVVRTYAIRSLLSAEIDLYTEQGEIAEVIAS